MEKEDVVKAVQEKLDEFKKNLTSFATAEDVNKMAESMKAEYSGMASKNADLQKSLDELQKAAEAQGLALKKMGEMAANERPKSLKEQIEPLREKLINIQKGSQERVSLSLKAAPNHLLANITSDNNGMFLPGVGQVQRRTPLIRSLLNNNPVGANNHGTIYYTDQLAVVSGASAKAEGSGPAATSILTWQGYSLPLEQIKDKVRVSLKALDDVDFVASEVQNFVNLNMALAVESELYSGSGSTPHLYGLTTRATAYSAASAGDNGKVESPSIIDLLLAVKKAASKDTAFMPTFALLSHEDYASLRWQKDKNGQYFISPFVVGPISIHGILVLPSSLVTSDTMLVGDGNYSNVYSKGLNLQFGLDGNDFTEGYVTLLGVEEMAQLIKTVHVKAFQSVASIAAELGVMTKGV